MFHNVELFTCLSLLSIYHFKSLPICFLVISSLMTIFFPGIFTSQIFANSNLNASLFAISNASAVALLYTVIVLHTPRVFSRFVPLIVILNSLYITLSPAHYGLGMATSFDAMLLAIMYPVYLRWIFSSVKHSYLSSMLIVLPVIAIFTVKGSVGIGGLTLGMIILYSRPRYFKFLLVPILLFIAYYFVDPKLFNDSLRFSSWRLFFDWWWINANHWMGTGFGTFSILGPYIQVMNNFHVDEFFVMMHNDWLQCLFEFGYIGLAVLVSSFLYLVWRARADRTLLATVLTFGACALFYYPSGNVILAMFGVSIVKEVIYIN